MDSEIVKYIFAIKTANTVRKSNFGDVPLDMVNCVVSTVFYTLLIF